MKLLVLIDLDDTLLSNDINGFVPVYFQALRNYVSSVPGDLLIKQILYATQKMVEKNTPSQTLEHTFDEHFYTALGYQKEELKPVFDRFYAEAFPELKHITHSVPEAIQLIEGLFAKGSQVAIATNPLFPRTAILQRLAWAGLPLEDYPFSLVTSYEEMHFAKPNIAYYAEILGQLGWPELPAVMIGNNVADDLKPAAELGLPTFLVSAEKVTLPEGIHPDSMSGSLTEVLPWLESIASIHPKLNLSSTSALLAILKSTPAAYETLTKGLSKAEWRQRPDPKEWSLTEMACHWRDVDREVNLPRFQQILAEENPFLPGIDTDPWVDQRGYNQENGLVAFQEWLETRQHLTQSLELLQSVDWQRPARHAVFGPTDLRELVSFIVTHDRVHLRQVFKALQAIHSRR